VIDQVHTVAKYIHVRKYVEFMIFQPTIIQKLPFLTTAASGCTLCASGFTMTVGACVENSFLINCPVGQYKSNSACVDCSAGHYNNATAQADCNDECPTGTWSTRAASECTKCNEGTTQLDLSTANAAADTGGPTHKHKKIPH